MVLENADVLLTQNNLTKLSLLILTEDANLSDIYLFQPSGNITADANGVRVTSAGFDAKVSNFITAFATQGDLLATPEYCCPWSLVIQINNGLIPKRGGIWAFGFQSITPTELQTVITSNPNIRWLAEVPEAGTHTFLNPLIYFFHATDTQGINRIVALVQFKTSPMVDTELQLERNQLILGKKVYCFANQGNSIHLASILCSDSLNGFDPTTFFPQWPHLPHILLHLQMNTDPTHNLFSAYRSKWSEKVGDKKQIICLNWAKETRINNQGNGAWFGRSSFLTKDTFHVRMADHLENHNKGMYYTYSEGKRIHSFYLNFDEFCFHLRVAKAGRATVDAASANFPCPKCIDFYTWQAAQWITSATLPNDNYQQSCVWIHGGYACLNGQVISLIEKEIIMNWATGHFGEFHKLFSVTQTDSEKIRRVTFAQDLSTEAVTSRQSLQTLFTSLCVDVLTNANLYPPNIAHFSQGHSLQFNNKNFTLLNAQDKALVCYIGDASDDEVERCYADACRYVHENDYRKVCIWYRRFGTYQSKVTLDNKITTAFEHPADITREQ